MKAHLLIIALAGIILYSCDGFNGNSDASLEDQINDAERALFSDSIAKIDKRKALDIVNLYQDFAEAYPDDPRSPEYLFKAGDLSINLNRPTKTIHIFETLISRYPESEKAATSLFLKGFVLEDQMKDFDEARRVYEEFLEKYPDSEFADDAEISIANLGKTPEELIREFEQKNQ